MAMGLLGGALATAVIEKVVAVASTHIGGYFKWRMGMEEELQRLTMLRPQIHSVVDAAERGEQQISDPLREWLRQLKDALYEADDVADELDYQQLKQQSRAIKLVKRIIRPDPTLDKLRRAVKKLDEVAAGVGVFFMLLSNAQREFQQQETQTVLQRETGPLLTENKVLGREEERDELLQWLTDHEDESNMNISLLSVVGHGGMGKTTLAQLVFNDDIVQKSFDLKIWVCVSTSFDVKGLTRSILESATKQRPDVDGLPALQDALKEKLETSGKFLLIFDDVWNDDSSSNWDKLLAPLKYGHKGSKILLTTRMAGVADMAARAMGTSAKGSLKLGGLNGADFSSLFNRYAFAGVDHGNYPNLHCIGMQIVKRLGSSPLAAKIVGGLLNSHLDDSYWTKILHSKNISVGVQHGEDNIMSILMLSYHHLPLHLRPCFAYCCMFPKDHEFWKQDLVLMWMAAGLIQHSHQNEGEVLEDIGGYYFDELLRRSLFDQKFTYCYVMHDLLHDLAQSVSHGECSSFVDNDKKVEDTIPNTVRHLYIESGNLGLLSKMDYWHNLCSLVLIIKNLRPEHFSTLEKVLRSLKSIRLLHVDLGYGEVTMPDAFNHLIHLRSLKIDGVLQQFPRSLCKLYHLQVLKLCYGESTTKLPESLNKLVNLRHLSANNQVAGVGKLIFLQELNFSVRKERGYKIGELGDLKWLRRLSIGGLENVENQEEASTAKLSSKKDLQTLDLAWSASRDPGVDKDELTSGLAWSASRDPGVDKDELVLDRFQPHANLNMLTIEGYGGSRDPGVDKDELVLDRLQPHANLNMLTIEGYGGIRHANWMGFELINNLRYICLSNCSRLDHLPPLGRLHFLEVFELKNMPAIKKLDFQCQHLKDLFIYNMEGLEEMSGSGGDAGQWHPHLRTLKIRKCPKLGVMPSLSLSIKRIHLDKLGLVSLPTLWLDSSTCSASGSSSSLQVLKIKNCGKITSLGEGLLQHQHYLTALERLLIWDCAELVDFPSGGLQHLRALNDLKIWNCPKLQVAPAQIIPQDGNDDKFLPSSLRTLEIREGCAELVRSIPTLLKGIVLLDELYLKDLVIERYPKLVHSEGSDFTVAVERLWIDVPLLLASGALLRNITSVRELRIWKCKQLESIDGELEQWVLKNQTTMDTIEIHEASSLKSLPSCLKNLSSLEDLQIWDANETLIKRCRKDKGADWPTIRHIPKVIIES